MFPQKIFLYTLLSHFPQWSAFAYTAVVVFFLIFHMHCFDFLQLLIYFLHQLSAVAYSGKKPWNPQRLLIMSVWRRGVGGLGRHSTPPPSSTPLLVQICFIIMKLVKSFPVSPLVMCYFLFIKTVIP